MSNNQTALSLQYHGAFYISVAHFRITMPHSTHLTNKQTFQHVAENAAMLVLFGTRMPSA